MVTHLPVEIGRLALRDFAPSPAPHAVSRKGEVVIRTRRGRKSECRRRGKKRSFGGADGAADGVGSDLDDANRLDVVFFRPRSHLLTSDRSTRDRSCPPSRDCSTGDSNLCDSILSGRCDNYNNNTDHSCTARLLSGDDRCPDLNKRHAVSFKPAGRVQRHTHPSNVSSYGSYRHVSRRDLVLPILCYWLLGYTLLGTQVVRGAAVSSPPSSFSSSYSSTGSRYRLISPALNNDSVFIVFSPSSILNLRVNTRQFVYFNFSLLTRQSRLAAPRKATILPPNNNDDSPFSSAYADLRDPSSTSRAPVNYNHTVLPARLLSLTTGALPSVKSNHNGSRDPVRRQPPPINGPRYRVMIYSDDESIARPLPNGWAPAHVDARGTYLLMDVTAGRQHNFSVEARHVGRVTMSVAVVGDKGIPQASYVQAVAATQYQVTTVRGERTADIVFNSAAAAIALIINFGIGAITDLDSLKRQIKFPVALIIGFCCQFVIMPVLAFGMAMLLPLQRDISLGLLCVACVPGGGLSHVAVIIADGDTALSLTMNMITVVAMLGTAPLWLFILGQYFQTNSDAVISPKTLPIYYFEIWLAAAFFAYAFGLTIKRLRPAVADALLMWLIKPFLLLASILYITLGVYINMYVFELVNTFALLGAALLPLFGCLVGAAAAFACRQTPAVVKTIALETSGLNGLVVLVALRFSLRQPDADLAAMIPIWVMFTVPGLFVSLAVCRKAKSVVLHYWRQRSSKDAEIQGATKAYSVSSSVVSPPGTTTLSAPLVAGDCLDDDATISTMSNQKVTVL